MPTGKKSCVNCNTEIGFRTKLCPSCGWHFFEGKVRMDLLEVKKDSESPVYYEEEGRGRKRCPGCNKIVGGRTVTCYCGFDFGIAKIRNMKIKTEPVTPNALTPNALTPNGDKIVAVPNKVTKISLTDRLAAEMKNYVYTPPVIKTKREHAQEIIDRGHDRALFMYNYARTHKLWSHVDWDYIAEQLGIKKENSDDNEYASTDQQNSE